MQELMISLRKLRSALRWFRNKGFDVELEYVEYNDHYNDSYIEKMHGVIDHFIVERNENDPYNGWPSFKIHIYFKNGKVFKQDYFSPFWSFYGEYNPLEIKMKDTAEWDWYLTIRKL